MKLFLYFVLLIGSASCFSSALPQNTYSAILSDASPSLRAESPESRDVNLAQGPVRGYQDPVGPFIFYDIPYATSPTGTDRFKAVRSPPTWLSTFEAVNRSVTCPQSSTTYGTRSEDCHVASVYVPDTNRSNLPVHFIIHGGAYQFGYGNERTPKEFVQSKEIIAVTFNYRLAVHGLLCLGTKTAPGNAALKDQVAALRWVKQNIASFGGNPDDITLSGYSVGAASATLLMLSKTVKGIFNKVIVDSGSNMADWAADQEPLERAKQFAQQLNFTNVNNITALEEFYTTTPLEVLMSIDEMFAPCVERNLGEETFMEQSPYEIIKSGDYPKLPLLYGFCNEEGLTKISSFDQYLTQIKSMNKDLYASFPLDLYYETEDERNDVAKRVKEFYFRNQAVSVENVQGFVDFESDSVFIHPILRTVGLYIESGHDQVYLYEYTFPARNSLPFPGNVTIVGATHASPSAAVYDEDEDTFTEEHKQMKRKLRDLWYNFIITRTPVPSSTSDYPDWPPVNSPSRTPYMNVNTNPKLRNSFCALSERIQLWDDIYDKHYRIATPPNP